MRAAYVRAPIIPLGPTWYVQYCEGASARLSNIHLHTGLTGGGAGSISFQVPWMDPNAEGYPIGSISHPPRSSMQAMLRTRLGPLGPHTRHTNLGGSSTAERRTLWITTGITVDSINRLTCEFITTSAPSLAQHSVLRSRCVNRVASSPLIDSCSYNVVKIVRNPLFCVWPRRGSVEYIAISSTYRTNSVVLYRGIRCPAKLNPILEHELPQHAPLFPSRLSPSRGLTARAAASPRGEQICRYRRVPSVSRLRTEQIFRAQPLRAQPRRSKPPAGL